MIIQNQFAYLDEGEIKLSTTGVVVFDLDDLKVINDNFVYLMEKSDIVLTDSGGIWRVL